jgi:hypothetical protein
MSRTIRNRTPSNGLNDYAFHQRKDCLERWRKQDDTDSEAIDNFLTFYRRDGYCMRGNKKFRYAKNRSQKQSFKQIIHHALKNDSFDNVTNLLCFKSVRNRYW